MKSLKSLAVTSAFLVTGGIALATAPPQKATTPPQTKAYQSENMNNNGQTQNTAEVHHVTGTSTARPTQA